MKQSLRFYDKVYPLYLAEGMREKMIEGLFPIFEELDGFIAFGTCDFNFMGRHYGNYVAFANPIYREAGGIKLANHGFDMRDVAIAEPIKLRNPMPIYKEYRDSEDFGKYIHAKLKTYNDKVILSSEELIKIITSVQEALETNKIAIYELYNLNELPLPNVSVVLGRKTFNFATNKETKTITFENYLLNNMLYRVALRPKIDDEGNMVDTAVDVKFISPVLHHKDLPYNEYANIFLAINYYIKHIPASYTENKKKVEETIAVGKGNNKKYKRVVHLERSFTFEKLDKMSKTHIKHIFSCLCWGVRGHVRHYKSGKVVFIQPFKKGKERNNMSVCSEKEYRL